MAKLSTFTITYYYEGKRKKPEAVPITRFAEATGTSAGEALETFYRSHADPDKIKVTSCKRKPL